MVKLVVDVERRVVAIGGELHADAEVLNRALYHLELGAWDLARSSYERVLNLIGLAVGSPLARSRRRELLRWRELVATLYLESAAPVAAHVEAFRCLLRLTPESSRQIAELPVLRDARR